MVQRPNVNLSSGTGVATMARLLDDQFVGAMNLSGANRYGQGMTSEGTAPEHTAPVPSPPVVPPAATASPTARVVVSRPARPDSVRRHNLSLILGTILEAGRAVSR